MSNAFWSLFDDTSNWSSYHLLQQLPPPASSILLNILDPLWLWSTISSEWLHVLIAPVPKKELNQYCLIALMSWIRKIVESIICTRITHCLELNSLIPRNIFGYRHQSGTIACLSTLVADIYTSFIQKKYLNAAFLSAFPSVRIPKLLEICNNIGCPHPLTNLIGRLFSALVFHSSNANVQRTLYWGLPQGNPLSPILLIIYTLELVQLPISSKIFLYADDVVICRSHYDLQSAKLALQRSSTHSHITVENYHLFFLPTNANHNFSPSDPSTPSLPRFNIEISSLTNHNTSST